MENRLKCDATSCMYNVERLCGAEAVRVKGGDTEDGDDTFCSTYTFRSAQGMVSEAGNISLTNSVADSPGPLVECSAVNCMYNKEYLCSADELKVLGEHSASPTQTECRTFNPR